MDTLLISGAVFVLTLGVVFGWGLREPGLIGGGLGCAIGSLADGWSATSVVSSGPGGGKFVVLRLAVDADIIATGILLTLVMGLLGGLLPALSAMRCKPLDALR